MIEEIVNLLTKIYKGILIFFKLESEADAFIATIKLIVPTTI